MITKLTKEQEEKIPVYLKKWLDIGYRTKSINKKKAQEAINFLYKDIMKIDKPKYVIFLDSPMACELAYNLIKNTKYDSQLDSQLYSQLYSQLRSQLGSQLRSQLDSQLYSQLDSQLRSQLDSQLYSQLRSQLGSQLRSQLDSQLDPQLGSQLGSQLRSQLDSQLRSQLDSQLDSQLRSQLDSQLGSQLGSQLRSQLGSQKLEYCGNWIYTWGWGNYYGFYDYILNEIFPDKKSEFKLFSKFIETWPELHYYLPFKDIVFVSDFPKEININNEKQLHKDGGPALLYRDTYSLYKLNGITVSKEIAETPAEKITKEMITKEENADTRREVIRKVGANRLEKLLDVKVLDSKDEYQLISFDIGDGRTRPFLKMTCPSTKLTHIIGVRPEHNTCAKGLAFLFNQSEWKRPILEDGFNNGGSVDDFKDGQVLYRHGDVNFKKYAGPINEVKKPISAGIIHKGNNNNHEYISGLFEIQEVNGKKIVVVLDDSTIGHNEHGNQVTPPGAYEIDIAVEFDHWTEEARRVID